MASKRKRKLEDISNENHDDQRHLQQETKRRKLQNEDTNHTPCSNEPYQDDSCFNGTTSRSVVVKVISDMIQTVVLSETDVDPSTNQMNQHNAANQEAETSTVTTNTVQTVQAAAPMMSPYPYNEHNFESPKMILRATSSFADNDGDHYKWIDGGNFLKGIWWSPNGQYLLSSSNDRRLRMFNPLNDIYYGNGSGKMSEFVVYRHREPVYDVSWYPLFRTNDPSSNVFLSCSRDSPIFLFDSWQNCKRSSYSYRFADCVMTPYSVSFDSSGQYLYGGYKRFVIQFATSRSGEHHCRKIDTINSNRMGQKSIISVIRFMPQSDNVFATGCYDGLTQLFDTRCQAAICALKCVEIRNRGITDLAFSPCTNYLLSGQRNGPDIDCWDLRALKQRCYVDGVAANGLDGGKFHDHNTRVLKDNDKAQSLCAKYKRTVFNHQRVYFDIDQYSGSWIVSGHQVQRGSGQTAHCTVYDINCSEFEVEPRFKLEHDVGPNGEDIPSVTSVSAARLCPTYPFLATTIGQRTYLKRARNRPIIGTTDVEQKANDSDSTEWTSESECEDEMANVNDVCIWDLRVKQQEPF